MDIICSLGPSDDEFYLRLPGHIQKWNKVPREVTNKLISASNRTELSAVNVEKESKLEFRSVYCYATDGVTWVAAGEQKDGKKYWKLSDKTQYPKLYDWLRETYMLSDTLDSDIEISFGQNGAFFAASRVGFRWDGLPTKAEEALQSKLKPRGWTTHPLQVALGINTSYVIIFKDHTPDYDCKDSYPSLYVILDNIGDRNERLKYVALSQGTPDCFFCVRILANQSSQADYNVPEYLKGGKMDMALAALKAKFGPKGAPFPKA